jgi:hypothetical protein
MTGTRDKIKDSIIGKSINKTIEISKGLFTKLRKKKEKPSDEEETPTLPPPSPSPPPPPQSLSKHDQRTDSQPNLADYYHPKKAEEDLKAEKKLKEDQDREAEQVARETAESRQQDAVRP